jgi:hypothetical protein
MLNKAILWQNLVRVVYHQGPTAATAAPVDHTLFDAIDCDYELVAASEVHGTAGSDGSAVTADLKRSASGTTVTGGTSLLASTFDLKSTAATPVVKKVSTSGLAATQAGRTISKGQRLGLDFGGTLTALEACCITVFLRPLRRPTL